MAVPATSILTREFVQFMVRCVETYKQKKMVGKVKEDFFWDSMTNEVRIVVEKKMN